MKISETTSTCSKELHGVWENGPVSLISMEEKEVKQKKRKCRVKMIAANESMDRAMDIPEMEMK